MGMLKKAASGVLALLPCSCTESTLRASNNGEPQRDLASNSRPCWTDFFDHSPRLLTSISPRTFTYHRREKFNKPIMFVQPIFSILLASALTLLFFTGCSGPIRMGPPMGSHSGPHSCRRSSPSPNPTPDYLTIHSRKGSFR